MAPDDITPDGRGIILMDTISSVCLYLTACFTQVLATTQSVCPPDLKHTSTCPSSSSSPLLLLLVHGDSARAQGHHQQQASDDRRGLEEVVLQEVVHGFVGRDAPEGVEGEVDAEQPDHQSQSGQLGFEAHRHQHNEGGAHQVLQDLHTAGEQTEPR